MTLNLTLGEWRVVHAGLIRLLETAKGPELMTTRRALEKVRNMKKPPTEGGGSVT